MTICFVSRSNGVKEVSDFLGGIELKYIPTSEINMPVRLVDLLRARDTTPEIAKAAFAALKTTIIAEDLSMHVTALNGDPGVHVNGWIKRMGPDRICNMLREGEKRDAWIELYFVLTDEKGTRATPPILIEGELAAKPVSLNPLHLWEGIFCPRGSNMTVSQILNGAHEVAPDPETVELVQLRKRASRLLANILTEKISVERWQILGIPSGSQTEPTS